VLHFFGGLWKELASLASLVVILTFLKKPLGRAVRWLRANLRPDHTTLQGSHTRQELNARGPQGFIHVAIAPSWRLRRLERPLNTKVVHTWLTGVLAEAPAPDHRDPGELIRYRFGPMENETLVWAYRRGRLDLTIPVAIAEDEGRRLLPLENAVRPLWRLARSVEEGGYEAMFGRGLRRRRRLDWRIGVSTFVLDANQCLVAIDDFTFPGRRPGPKPGAMRLNGVPSESTLRGLESLPSSADARRIVRTALGAILTASGYEECGPAIDDTLDVVAGQPAAEPAAELEPAP